MGDSQGSTIQLSFKKMAKRTKEKWEILHLSKLSYTGLLHWFSEASLQGTMTLMDEALRIASLPRTLTLHPPSCPLLRDPWSKNCWLSLVNVYFYLKYQAWGPELRKARGIQPSPSLYAHYPTLTMTINMAISQGFLPTRVPGTDASLMLPIILSTWLWVPLLNVRPWLNCIPFLVDSSCLPLQLSPLRGHLLESITRVWSWVPKCLLRIVSHSEDLLQYCLQGHWVRCLPPSQAWPEFHQMI